MIGWAAARKGPNRGQRRLARPLHVINADLLEPKEVVIPRNFWRESLNDGLYGVSSNILRSSAGTSSRYVGSQPALTVTRAPNHHLAVVTDFESFVAGPFLEKSDSSDNVTFSASWLTFTF
jgi:hypothetical protein